MKALVGYGIVGKATHAHVMDYEAVDIYDIKNIKDFGKRQYTTCVICVPTNTPRDVEQLREICVTAANNSDAVMIRSTVPPDLAI